MHVPLRRATLTRLRRTELLLCRITDLGAAHEATDERLGCGPRALSDSRGALLGPAPEVLSLEASRGRCWRADSPVSRAPERASASVLGDQFWSESSAFWWLKSAENGE